MIQVGLLGANGRMGKWIDQIIEKDYSERARIQSRITRGDDQLSLLQADVVLDVSHPQAMVALIKKALQHPKKLPAFVVGSTGWGSEEISDLKKLAKKTPVLISSNFSVGIYILNKILKDNAALLKSLGYSAVLMETHHCHKKDAPSGTALSIQKALMPYTPTEIQTHSIRAGEVIGDHQVTFYGPADHLRLSHSAQDRSIFARGAIDVALWLSTLTTQPSPPSHLLEMSDYFQHLLLK